MATNYIQPGDVLEITNSTGSAVASGEPIAIGFNRAGIALVDIANAAAGSVQVSGVFELAKNTSDAAVVGAPAYWKGSADEVVNAPEVGALFLGFFTESAIAAATTGRVKLASFADEGPRLLTLAAAADTTLTAADFTSGDLILVGANTADIVVNLPAVATVPVGARLRVKKTSSDAKKITLDGNASENIGGSTTFATIDADGDTALFINTGSAWQLIDSTIA